MLGSSVLRECLQIGMYLLVDEGFVLKERLDKKERVKWVKSL